MKLEVKNLGLSFGIVSAIGMLLLGILGKLGLYMGAVEMMEKVHMFFDLTFVGILLGIVEGFVWGAIIGVGVAYFYNLFVTEPVVV